MDESTKKKMHMIEISVAIIIVLVSVVSFFPNSGITGFVSMETKKQSLDLVVQNSQSHILTTKDKEFILTSLRLSGEVIGDGIAKMYLSNGQEKILIYSNVMEKSTSASSITGMSKLTGAAVNDQPEETEYLIVDFLENIDEDIPPLGKDEKIAPGKFLEKCHETCYIEMLLNPETAYELIFYVEEGTTLVISEIVYTIQEE